MRQAPRAGWIAGLLTAVVLGTGTAGAEPPPNTTYTNAELAALDKALAAANMDRHDLTFRKDLAEGHAALPLVMEMLRDPLTIAPGIDAFVAEIRQTDAALHAPLGALIGAHMRVPHTTALHGLVPGEPYAVLESLLRAGARVHPAPAGTPEALLAYLGHMASVGGRPLHLRKAIDAEESEPLSFEDVRYRMLRRYLPEEMTWHAVFASPYEPAVDSTLATLKKEAGASHVHDLAARISVASQIEMWLVTFRDPLVWLLDLPLSAFPTDKPRVVPTPYGRVALGTPGDDVYEGDYAMLIDPGGNDRYVGCRIGAADGTKDRRVGFFADLGGNDVYDCGAVDITLGAAVLGVAAFFDLGVGDDRYLGGHASLGAAMGGVATFYDDGGSDTYEGKTFTQGAAGFGVGVFQDDAVQARPETSADEGTQEPVEIGLFDNDRLKAWANAQAFARCRGVAICLNTRGNDIYEAGGVYLHAPLFADRYQSFSQGFAIGERGVDYAGGIALIADYDGNDRYLGDIYNQGVGYWYSAGLLYDGGGNDLYEMTQYGQGSGIHLAVGGLVDVDGNDTYVMHSGLGQGGSHDYAASILHDRGGNDHYMGMTSCNGCGLTNSVGLHIDRAGDDTYAGRKDSINTGRPARGFSSIGVLVDLAGEDHYLGIMEDGTVWRHADVGVGVDLAAEPAAPNATPPNTPAADQPGDTVEIPPICRYEGELTQAVFDELWAIAIRWEVGENRRIVPEARKRLIAFGAPILPYVDVAMETGASGLELRAFQGVLTGLRDGGATEGVTAFLRRNLEHESERRKRVALWLATEMKAAETEAQVAALLRGDDEALARRAAGVLRAIGSHAGDEVLLTWLDLAAQDELRTGAALDTLLSGEADCFGSVRLLLDHPLVSVRSRLATLLAAHPAAYGPAMEAELEPKSYELPRRGLRTLLDAFARRKAAPSPTALKQITRRLDDEHWGLRADAARALQAALADEALATAVAAEIRTALAARAKMETEPYVLFWLAPR